MGAPLITPSVPAGTRRRGLRNTAAVAGVAALIAAGGYAATNTFGPDAHEPPVPVRSDPTDQVLDELRASVAGQYGSTREHSQQVMRELRQSVAGQFGGGR
jgi:hypothetical protein